MVWVNGKILDTSQPKAKEWSPAAKKGKTVWGTCPDCGKDILSGETVWWMHDKKVCMDCHQPYFESGIGHLDCCDLILPEVSLEG